MIDRRLVRPLVAALAAMILVGALAAAFLTGAGPLPDRTDCTARAGGRSVDLGTDEAESATLVAATAIKRRLPARAVTIALTASAGDLDQLTPARIGALFDRLPRGYREMPIASAARQAGGPGGLGVDLTSRVAEARVISSAVTGQSRAAFTCVADGDSGPDSRRLTAKGLTPRAERVLVELDRAFGRLPTGGYAPGGVSTGHMKGSAHYEGRAVDVFVRPIDAANKQRGWAIASYLVAHADRLGIDHVIFDARIWSGGLRSRQGWRTYSLDTSGKSAATAAILLHRDHVHYDVP